MSLRPIMPGCSTRATPRGTHKRPGRAVHPGSADGSLFSTRDHERSEIHGIGHASATHDSDA